MATRLSLKKSFSSSQHSESPLCEELLTLRNIFLFLLCLGFSNLEIRHVPVYHKSTSSAACVLLFPRLAFGAAFGACMVPRQYVRHIQERSAWRMKALIGRKAGPTFLVQYIVYWTTF